MASPANEAAAQLILAALHTAQVTGAWFKGQLPDVIHQLLLWGIVDDSMLIGISAVYLLIFGLIARWIAKHPGNTGIDSEPSVSESQGVFLFLGTLIAVLMTLVLLYNAFDLIQVLIAPKVWLLDYARSLMVSR